MLGLQPFVPPLALLAWLVVVAASVNRFARDRRGRLRSPALAYLGYLALLGAFHAARWAAWEDLARWFDFFARLAGGFCAVHLLALLVVDVGASLVRGNVPTLVADLFAAVGYGVVFAGVIAQTGVNPASAVAGGTVVAAVLTISLQGTLGNVIGGVALQLDGSIQLGDWIQLEGGRQGRVTAVRWRHVVIETRDGDSIILPNSVLLATPFTRLGNVNGSPSLHRQRVLFRVDYRTPPARVCQVVHDALLRSPIHNVASHPAPSVVCLELNRDVNDSSALYEVRYWIEDLLHDGATDSDVRARIHAGLRRQGIRLAIPAHTMFEADLGGAVEQHDTDIARAFAALRRIDLFRGLSDEECENLAQDVSFVPFAPGEVITRQGATAHYLYLLTAGQVEIRVARDGRDARVDTVEAPDFFGEMGLLTGTPRSASVIALTAADCFRLDRAAFEQVLSNRPEVASEVAAALAQRHEGLEAVAAASSPEDPARHAEEVARIAGMIRGFFGL